jgi:hypothetical protein
MKRFSLLVLLAWPFVAVSCSLPDLPVPTDRGDAEISDTGDDAAAHEGGKDSASGGETDSGPDASIEDSADSGDAGSNSDASIDAGPSGYTLSASPSALVIDPGTQGAIVVTIVRTGGFSEAINLSLQGGPTGIVGTASIPGNATTGMLNLSAAKSATVGQTAMASISATSAQTGVAMSVPLFVRVGHLLLAADSTTTFVVPSDVSEVTFAVWGAGGGGGGASHSQLTAGAPGGSGGFVQANLTVTPGQSFQLVVATPGAGGVSETNATFGGGGGGGGYSAVTWNSQTYFVAGGGGGGGGANSAQGQAGGAGGGASGVTGLPSGGCGGGPGTETVGGSSLYSMGAGSSLQGGKGIDFAPNSATGGVPGGGSGGGGGLGGGGGGGYFGGGGGYQNANPGPGCGGGGGSGFVFASATNAIVSAGNGTLPPSTNHPFYANGAAVGGTGGTEPTGTGIVGSGGRIVVYIPL